MREDVERKASEDDNGGARIAGMNWEFGSVKSGEIKNVRKHKGMVAREGRGEKGIRRCE